MPSRRKQGVAVDTGLALLGEFVTLLNYPNRPTGHLTNIVNLKLLPVVYWIKTT